MFSSASLPLSQRGEAGFTVKLEVTPWPTSGTVYYKCDGGRFEAGDTTIKLCSGLNYEFKITVSPPLTCRSCKLKSGVAEAQELKRLDGTAAEGTDAQGNGAAGTQPAEPTPQQQQTGQAQQVSLIDLDDELPSEQPPPTQHDLGPLQDSPFNLAAHTASSPAETPDPTNPFAAPPAADSHVNPFTTTSQPGAANPFTEAPPETESINPFLGPVGPSAPHQPLDPNPFLAAPAPVISAQQHQYDNPFTAPMDSAHINPFHAATSSSRQGRPADSLVAPANSNPINPFLEPAAPAQAAAQDLSNPFISETQLPTATPALAQPLPPSTTTATPAAPDALEQPSTSQSLTPENGHSGRQLGGANNGVGTAGKETGGSGLVIQGTRLPSLASTQSAAAGQAKYSWGWTCGISKSSKGDRRTVQLMMDTQELGLVELPMLVKVYKPTSKGRLNGLKLRWVQYGVVPHSQLEGRGQVVHCCPHSLP